MGLYVTRALKYLVRMTVIIGLIFVVLAAFGLLETRGMTFFQALFMSWRGMVIIGLLVVLAIAYPKISFTTTSIRGSLAEHRDDVVNAFAVYGYSLVQEDETGMIFRANSTLRRVLWQFDDPVRVWQKDKSIEVEGLKKIVPRVELRLRSYLNN